MYTVKEVAKKIGASYSHVKLLIAKGHLRAVDVRAGVNHAWRVSDEDLAAFLKSRTNTNKGGLKGRA